MGDLKVADSDGDVSFSPPELVEAVVKKGERHLSSTASCYKASRPQCA